MPLPSDARENLRPGLALVENTLKRFSPESKSLSEVCGSSTID
jgi:hypothetical protein